MDGLSRRRVRQTLMAKSFVRVKIIRRKERERNEKEEDDYA